MSNDKITGWVAWHPEHGTITVALSRASCEERLSGVNHYEFQRHEEYAIAHDSELRRLNDKGWRIRPVELRFTDEEEEK